MKAVGRSITDPYLIGHYRDPRREPGIVNMRTPYFLEQKTFRGISNNES